MGGGIVVPPNSDQEEFAERLRRVLQKARRWRFSRTCCAGTASRAGQQPAWRTNVGSVGGTTGTGSACSTGGPPRRSLAHYATAWEFIRARVSTYFHCIQPHSRSLMISQPPCAS